MQISLRNLYVSLFLATTCVSASPVSLVSRAVISHDAVEAFPQTVPSGIAGSLYLKYKPFLEVYTGCIPYPAVNAAGDTRSVRECVNLCRALAN